MPTVPFLYLTIGQGDLSENEKKAKWMPTNLIYIEDAPRSLSQSQKEYARAPKRGRRERLESEIGGVFVVFVGGGDLRNLFSGGHFCDFFNGRDLSGRKAN